MCLFRGVTLLRLERRTYCLEGSCSIQLSYRAKISAPTATSRRKSASISSGHPDSNWGSPAPKAGAITGLRYIPSVLCHIEKDALRGVFLGGEGGIRTPGTLIEYDSLANCWFQPLTHLSECSSSRLKAPLSLSKSGAKVRTFFILAKFFFFFQGTAFSQTLRIS